MAGQRARIARRLAIGSPLLVGVALALACSDSAPLQTPTAAGSPAPASRAAAIPAESQKQRPETDVYPPRMRSAEWTDPIPLPGPVNTAGAEDSPFIAPDGRLYFWFTPSTSLPAEIQLIDGVSGIYVSAPGLDGWEDPERVLLQDAGKVALDGCAFVGRDQLFFCTAREGWAGIEWFVADAVDSAWQNWRPASDLLPQEDPIGELHFSADGRTLIYHSDRPGGVGGRDLWMARRNAADGWSPSINLAEVNTDADEGWPYLSPDGRQLWFTRTYLGSPGIFRSQLQDGRWSEPELIVERFAGEPTLDAAGNLYFTHHFFRDGEMLEADIYVASPRG